MTNRWKHDISPFSRVFWVFAIVGEEGIDESVSFIDGIEQTVSRIYIRADLESMSEVYNLRKSLEVIKFFADHCKSGFCFVRVCSFFSGGKLVFHRGKKSRGVKEPHKLERIRQMFSSLPVNIVINPSRGSGS